MMTIANMIERKQAVFDRAVSPQARAAIAAEIRWLEAKQQAETEAKNEIAQLNKRVLDLTERAEILEYVCEIHGLEAWEIISYYNKGLKSTQEEYERMDANAVRIPYKILKSTLLKENG